jgi:hypothetical protein
VVGFGYNSFFWKKWNKINFSRASITLGGVPEHMASFPITYLSSIQEKTSDEMWVFPCEFAVGGEKLGQFRLKVSLGTSGIQVPEWIYDVYTKGRNFYQDPGRQGWEPLDIMFTPHTLMGEVPPPLMLGKDSIVEPGAALRIKGDDLIKKKLGSPLKIFLKASVAENRTIQIGVQFLRHYSVLATKTSSLVALQSTQGSESLSYENQLFFFILVTLLFRLKLTGINAPTESFGSYNNEVFGICAELFAMVISLVSFFLPGSLDIASGYPQLYYPSLVIVIINVGFKAWCIYESVEFLYSDRSAKMPPTVLKDRKVETNIIRNTTQDILIMTAMWMLLLQRRLEYLSNALVLLLNIYLVYDITSLFIIIVIYIVLIRSSKRSGVIGIFGVTAVLMVVYQVFATLNFFARPIYVRDYQEYEQIVVPALAVAWLILVALSMRTADTYLRNANNIVWFKGSNPKTTPQVQQ